MAQTVSPASIKFTVKRGASQLVTPAKPTPYEFKALSDLDWFRSHSYGAILYPYNPSMNGIDPAKVIRNAIAETLVFYYPFAGRLRETTTGKLIVECTGEGILFTEADADVTFDQFGYPIVPPIPCSDQILYEGPGSNDIFNSPLVLIQVTRLKCGGFIFCIRLSHNMCDAAGAAQFLSAIGEMAIGATSPSVLPVWQRHVLNSINLSHREHNHDIFDSTNDPNSALQNDMCYKAFTFGPTEISALRRRLPLHLRHCSSFEIITAHVWKCRAVALQLHPTQEMSLILAINLRGKRAQFIPAGYYGNAIALSISTLTAKEILENPVCYTLQVLRNSKEQEIEYYDQSVSNLMARMSSYTVSDLRYVGFDKVDFGWGKPMYSGFPFCVPMVGSYQMQFNRKKGELNRIILPVCLPNYAMGRFHRELNNMLKDHPFEDNISKL